MMIVITKPLLMISLLILFLEETRSIRTSLKIKIILAITLSWFGDVLLMLDLNPNFFILGLASFLIAHIAYIAANVSHGDVDSDKSILVKWMVWITASVYGLAMIWTLWPGLGDLMIPVIIYTVVILAMILTAFSRKVYYISWIYVLIGAVLFVISDSILAYNKFVSELVLGRLLVMSTYILAQYLLIRGYWEQLNVHNR